MDWRERWGRVEDDSEVPASVIKRMIVLSIEQETERVPGESEMPTGQPNGMSGTYVEIHATAQKRVQAEANYRDSITEWLLKIAQ